MKIKPKLTLESLQNEATLFAHKESSHPEPSLFGITDGKAVGTYLEHKFTDHLIKKYRFEIGNGAKGIDFPDISVDIKVTSIRQPQSSCPYKSARQKIFGLGYSLLVFVYEKIDNSKKRTSTLNILHLIFVSAERTSDFQMTSGLQKILDNDGNKEDLISFMIDKNLPVDEIEADKIAELLLSRRITIGYLTISNALQWRLQYSRVIEKAGKVGGVSSLLQP